MYKAIIFDFFGVIYSEGVFGDKPRIDKDLVKLIEALRGRYKLGLLSNSSKGFLRPILGDHRMDHLFDEIAVSGEVGFIKPEPEIFSHILEKLDVKAKDTVFIDDSPRNVAAAALLGIRGIVYTSEKALRDDLVKLGVSV